MSTRSAIARPNGDGFTGVYHHWDGYPSGLGRTLFRLFRDQTIGSVGHTLDFLIDKHPAGWSTINGADWRYSGHYDREYEICEECGRPSWQHYRQNYESRGLPKPNGTGPAAAPAWVFGHGPTNHDDAPKPAESYSEREAWEVTEKNAAGSGCEWAYVIDEQAGTMRVLSSYWPEDGTNLAGAKMIGMFGMGKADAEWREVALIYLDSNEPNWEALDQS
jgi:hypothetical protein